MEMLKYTFKVTHDKGIDTIKVISNSLDSAIIIVEKSEGCPRSAIALKSIFPAKQPKK